MMVAVFAAFSQGDAKNEVTQDHMIKEVDKTHSNTWYTCPPG